MRRTNCFVLFFFILTKTFSQDLSTVQRLIAGRQYLEAKQQIDSLLNASPKQQDARLWYYRGFVCTELVRRHEVDDPALLAEALSAYKKYQELDPSNRLMEADNNVEIFQLYDLSLNRGIELYNSEQYATAFTGFKTALETQAYILKKNFSFSGQRFPAVDTQLISLAGFSAYLSRQEEAAIPYFEKLAELGLRGEEFKGVYTVMIQHYQRKNEAVKATRLLNTGRQLFPDQEHWIKLEFGAPANERERLARYEQMLQKYPDHFRLHLDYAIELFNYCYGQAPPPDFVSKKERLGIILQKAVNLDPTSALAYAVMSQLIANGIYDSEIRLKTQPDDSPADKTRNQRLAADIDRQYESLHSASKKAFDLFSAAPSLSASDKAHYRKVLQQLIAYHQRQKQAEKANFYKERLKAVE